MAETSFPIIEQPLTDEQWKSVTKGIGNGALDEGGNPYRLINLDNASNTGVIAVDTRTGYNHAILNGFYHKMDSPITVSLPGVTRTTTYYIVLQYDPLNTSKPVSLKVVTSLDRTSGKDYLVLWTVVRQANQLLTNAVATKVRPDIAPTIIVDRSAQLPEATSVLWGTRAWCYMTSEEYRAASTSGWIPIGPRRIDPLNMPGWETSSPTGGIMVQNVSGGFHCSMILSYTRTGPDYTVPTTFHVMGTGIPQGYRPTVNTFCLANGGDDVMEVQYRPDGAVAVRGRVNSVHMPRGKSFTANIQWFVPRSYA